MDSQTPNLTRIYLRSEKDRRNASKDLQERIDNIANRIKFGLRSGYEGGFGLADREANYYAINKRTPFNEIEVWISIEIVQPLLRVDSNDAEK